MSRYAWTKGSPFAGDADEVQAELDRLKRTGGLTPEAVVACARPSGSVLHPLIFDGTTPGEALDKYHIDRARQIIKAIVIVREGEATDLRANYRVTVGEGERVWLSPDEIATDAALTDEVRARLIGKMRALKRQLDAFDVYPQVSRVLEEVLAA